LLESDESIYLVMEYLPGGELYEHIVQNKKLAEEESYLFFIQVVSAVRYLHSMNIVHRDLKPENLLLDKDKKVLKLVDFGLGRFFEDSQQIDTACGSPCYAPPEMLNKKQYDPIKADVWSLGIVLFAMVAGYLPFDNENTEILYKKIVEGKFKMPAWVSGELQDLLEKIIQTDPLERISLDQISQHSWCVKNQRLLQEQVSNCCLQNKHVNIYEVDEEVVLKLEKEGYDRALILNNLKLRVYSEVFCYYQLLKAQVERTR
jgi:5'-AMP-activated protein kinase catalytic alpha subunit